MQQQCRCHRRMNPRMIVLRGNKEWSPMGYNCHHWIGGRQLNPTPSSEITELLHAWSAGDQDAYNQIVKTVYPELRKIAQRCLRGERPQHTIQATALVH